jgi:isopenicillin-N epimerase
MSTRRSFLAGAGVAGLVGSSFRADALARAAGADKTTGKAPACELASNEDYWSEIQRGFETDRTIINFNNGGICPTPTHVLDQMIRDLRFTNESPTRHMWQVLEPRIESVRRDLAHEFGCDTNEIAITRNASESMEILIFGIDLKPGDEVIITDQNYPRMVTSWEQRARRDRIVVKKISFPIPLPSSSALVDRVSQAITPKTKVIELPHITNFSGQILPIRELVRLGCKKGIEVFTSGTGNES